MVTFEVFVNRFDNLLPFLKEKVTELLMKKETEIVKLSNQQLLQGLNVNDKIMQKGYSKGYSRLRQRKGLQIQYIDLKFSGKYQKTKKLVPDAQLNGLDIISNADYEVYLRGNFPEHVGLNKKNAEEMSEKIIKQLAIETKKYLVE